MGRDDSCWGSVQPDKCEDIRTQGTVAFYCLCAAYVLIHHSMYFGELQRIRFAGYVNMFAAHWRCWVLTKPGLTLGENFLTKECYSDLVQSCHEAVLQCHVFKTYCPSLPLRLKYSGSNVCENSFSAKGGYRGMHGKRNYTILDYTNSVEDEFVMSVLEHTGVRRGRAQHRKQEWDSRYHEPSISPQELDRKLSHHHDDSEKCSSWNAGCADASHFAEKIGLREGVDDHGWRDPWTFMREKLHVTEKQPEVEEDDDLVVTDDPKCCRVDDVQFVIMQVLRSKSFENTIEKKLQSIVSAYLFDEHVDENAVDDLAVLLASQEPVAVRKARQKQERSHHFVTIPGTDNEINKARLVDMVVHDVLRCGRIDGTQLSKDRIARIKATAARVKADRDCLDEPAVEGERVRLQDNLAFCFLHNNQEKRLWIGKLQQMRGKFSGRTRNVHHSIDLCDPPPDLLLQCQWYYETRKGSGKYKPSVKTRDVDNKFVQIKSCLGLIDMERRRDYYIISDKNQLNRILRIMDKIN